MHEAIIALRHVADEQLPDHLAAQLIEALDNASMGVARHLHNDVPVPRLARAHHHIQRAKTRVEEAQSAIQATRSAITDLIRVLTAPVD